MIIKMPHWPKLLNNNINIIPSLSRITDIMEKLGNPHLKIKNIIHVAGTNGKGSTTAFLRTILEKSGYTVNCFNSPALLSFNEEIILSGNMISNKLLFNILERCRITECNVTFYEGITAAAILAFYEYPADFTILETGMGGRLDATNIVKPIISIITKIALDHCEFLGNTLEHIAYEKAGIIKNDIPTIISWQKEQKVISVIKEIAIKRKSKLYIYGDQWQISKKDNLLEYKIYNQSNMFSLPKMIGVHQIYNASNAITAAYLLKNTFNKINFDTINIGLKETFWPGRLEKITYKNITKKIESANLELYFDGAHNPDGAETLKNWLKNEKVFIITGFTNKKNYIDFFKILKDCTESIYSVCVYSEPNSIKDTEIAEVVKKLLNIKSYACNNIKNAINLILQNHDKSSIKKILICGSLFLYKDLYNTAQDHL